MYLPVFSFLVDLSKKEEVIKLADACEFADEDVTYIASTSFIRFKLNNYTLRQLAYFFGRLGQADIEFDIV